MPFPSPMLEVKSESEVAQSCPTLATPWTATYQAPPSMGFSRQKYWSGVPLACFNSLPQFLQRKGTGTNEAPLGTSYLHNVSPTPRLPLTNMYPALSPSRVVTCCEE